MKKIISTDKAPCAIGPYSQAIEIDGMIYTSGQIPLDPDTMEIVGDTIEEQAHQVFKNITAVVMAAGSTMDDVVKTTCFMTNLGDFSKVNEIYGEYFSEGNYPARSAVQVSALPKGALLEIETITKAKK